MGDAMNDGQDTTGRGQWAGGPLAAPADDAISDEQRQQLAARLAGARERMAQAARRAGRDEDEARLIAVTKTVSAATARAAYDLGLRTFGENRVQEAQAKLAQLQLPDARWELIGHLQSNKAAQAARLFDRIESLDSLRLAGLLDTRAASIGRRLPVLLEVNVAGEASKSGFAPDELPTAAAAIASLPHLAPQGLMTVAPIADDPEQMRWVFRRLRELRDLLRETIPLQPGTDGLPSAWDELSMGMSDDFEVAIEEGATLIRLGRALFGDRPDAPKRRPARSGRLW